MVVGIDVTHPSPGSASTAPSVAGIVASVDSRLAQWPADLKIQTAREEMVSGRFVHGFLLIGTTVELWVFDRSGAYSSDIFGIHSQPELFIRVLAGYLLMMEKELGLDTFVEKDEDRRFVKIDNDVTGKKERLELESNITTSYQSAIVCRGTSCFPTKDGKNVVKFSWASAKRRESEHAHLLKARRAKVEGVAQLRGYYNVTSIAYLRAGLKFGKLRKMGKPSTNFPQQSGISQSLNDLRTSSSTGSKRGNSDDTGNAPKKSRSDSRASKLNQEVDPDDQPHSSPSQQPGITQEKFQNRELLCLAISPAGRPLRKFDGVPELLKAFRDSIKAHMSLFLAGILHRDISENNIIVTNPDECNGFSGMLIDLDLATNVGENGKNEHSGAQVMTGTMQFMAIEVLRGALPINGSSFMSENETHVRRRVHRSHLPSRLGVIFLRLPLDLHQIWMA